MGRAQRKPITTASGWKMGFAALYPSYKCYLPTHFGARFSENAFGPSM
jgi:hypothetical protein